jgi:hypothetical protein
MARPPQARWIIAVEHVSFLRSEGTPVGASRVAEGSVQVEVLFDSGQTCGLCQQTTVLNPVGGELSAASAMAVGSVVVLPV